MSLSVKLGHSSDWCSLQILQQTRSSQALTCAFSAGWLELHFKSVSTHQHFNFLCGRAPNHKYCYEIQEDGWKSLGYILRIIHCHGKTILYRSLYKKMNNCRTKLCWKEKKIQQTGKHFELFKELLRKLSANPIFSSSVTTTTKPSYMTNSVVLKSRKWLWKDILGLFHNSI